MAFSASTATFTSWPRALRRAISPSSLSMSNPALRLFSEDSAACFSSAFFASACRRKISCRHTTTHGSVGPKAHTPSALRVTNTLWNAENLTSPDFGGALAKVICNWFPFCRITYVAIRLKIDPFQHWDTWRIYARYDACLTCV